jgi:hypothetical protein
MALTISQMGVLYTERAAEAVPLSLRSLSLRLELRLEMESPQVRIDLHSLSRQRSMLGAAAFRAILVRHVDAEGVASLLALLDKFETDRKQTEPTLPPPAEPATSRRGLAATLRRVLQRRSAPAK